MFVHLALVNGCGLWLRTILQPGCVSCFPSCHSDPEVKREVEMTSVDLHSAASPSWRPQRREKCCCLSTEVSSSSQQQA